VCGRFVQGFDDTDLERLGELVDRLVAPPGSVPRTSFNIAPTHEAAIIRPGVPAPVLAPARFGLIPSWADDESIGSRLINARSETVREKPAFRGLVRTKRAIVPMSGFYEWQSVPGERRARPWYIRRADADPLLAAALWDTRTDGGGAELDSFSIITRAADPFVGAIHDRMPLVLEPDSIGAWLESDSADREIDTILHAEPRGVLTGHRVARRVGSPAHDDAALIEENAEGDQGSLFG